MEDWTSTTLSPRQGEAEQVIALDVLREHYLVEESTEDTDLLLKQHNLIRSLSLSHLKRLTYDA